VCDSSGSFVNPPADTAANPCGKIIASLPNPDDLPILEQLIHGIFGLCGVEIHDIAPVSVIIRAETIQPVQWPMAARPFVLFRVVCAVNNSKEAVTHAENAVIGVLGGPNGARSSVESSQMSFKRNSA
jgi:hypothetical protein